MKYVHRAQVELLWPVNMTLIEVYSVILRTVQTKQAMEVSKYSPRLTKMTLQEWFFAHPVLGQET